MRYVPFMAGPALAFGLAGCSGIQNFYEHKAGVGIPPPATIAEYASRTVQDSAKLGAGEYVAASISYTDEKCRIFFDLLEHYKQDSTLIDSVITAAIAAGSPLLALGASKEVLAVTTSSLSFANQYNKAAAEIFGFTTFKEQLMKHVLQGLDVYKTKTVYDRLEVYRRGNGRPFNNSRELSDLLLARSISAEYASLCSLAEMRRIVGEALNATTRKEGEAGQNTAVAASNTAAKK